MEFNYPKVRRENIKDNYFGTEVADPYRWLEDVHSRDTKKFVDEQNKVTIPYLEACSFRNKLKKSITEVWNYPKVSVPEKAGDIYFQSRNSGLQNQAVLYKMETATSTGKVFLDPNKLSKDGLVAIPETQCSKNGKTLAYSLSVNGSDWNKIKFRNVDTGKDYEDALEKVKFSSMAWAHDNIGFFYNAYPDLQGIPDGLETDADLNQKLCYHKLGTHQDEDIVIAEFDDSKLLSAAIVSNCGNYLVVTVSKGHYNALYYAKIDCEIIGKLKLNAIIPEIDVADYLYVTNNENKFIILTNRKAEKQKLIEIDILKPSEENWHTLIEEHETDVLCWTMPINNDKLIVCYLHDVKNQISLYDMETGGKIKDFPLDIGSIDEISGERNHKEMYFTFSSNLISSIIYKIDFEEDIVGPIILHRTKIGDIDLDEFVLKQEFYKSKDGTKIPMFITHKKSFVQDGTKPCLLHAYGGFNISLTPSFKLFTLLLPKYFDACVVIANIRGGGEYGKQWHEAGQFGNKQNCFDDFQWAAKYLCAQNYTNPKKLAIHGGSNGGLLVGACIIQAPQLYSAAICQVGVFDMFRFQKFTIGSSWVSEFGSSDSEKDFEYIRKYSPLHNVNAPAVDVQYPATLIMTADHDDRVVPMHSFKFISELQYRIGSLDQQKNPLMILVDTKTGHGSGMSLTKTIDAYVDMFCFLANTLDLKLIQ